MYHRYRQHTQAWTQVQLCPETVIRTRANPPLYLTGTLLGAVLGLLAVLLHCLSNATQSHNEYLSLCIYRAVQVLRTENSVEEKSVSFGRKAPKVSVCSLLVCRVTLEKAVHFPGLQRTGGSPVIAWVPHWTCQLLKVPCEITVNISSSFCSECQGISVM